MKFALRYSVRIFAMGHIPVPITTTDPDAEPWEVRYSRYITISRTHIGEDNYFTSTIRREIADEALIILRDEIKQGQERGTITKLVTHWEYSARVGFCHGRPL